MEGCAAHSQADGSGSLTAVIRIEKLHSPFFLFLLSFYFSSGLGADRRRYKIYIFCYTTSISQH